GCAATPRSAATRNWTGRQYWTTATRRYLATTIGACDGCCPICGFSVAAAAPTCATSAALPKPALPEGHGAQWNGRRRGAECRGQGTGPRGPDRHPDGGG